MAVLTVVLCALTVLAAYSDLINPNTWVLPSFLGIAFGVLLTLSVLWTVMLTVMRRWHGLMAMAVTLLVVMVPAWRICPLHLHEASPATTTDTGKDIEHIQRLKLLTYNTCLMGHAKLHSLRQSVPVLDDVLEADADVVCLQEFSYARSGHTLEQLMGSLDDKYPHHDFMPYSYNKRSGLAILSKYPIRKAERVDDSKRGYMAAIYYQLEVNGTMVGVVNMHLQSNRLAQEDRILYDEMIGHFEADSLSRIRTGMMHSLAVAWRLRAKEVERLSEYLSQHHPQGMPLLVCGDMNDTPVSYSSHKLRSLDLTDAWQEVGLGPGITYREHRFWFRIDHLFHNRGIRPLRMKVRRDIRHSDHFPIEATLQILPE